MTKPEESPPSAASPPPSPNRSVGEAGPPLLDVAGVSLQFGGIRALSDVSFRIRRGEIFSIIGPNGAGKTSMLNCISGRYRPSGGDIRYKGKSLLSRSINDRARIAIGPTFQNLALFDHMSVLANIQVGRHHLLKSNVFTGSLYWVLGAEREELRHRRRVEEIVDFLEIQHVRHEPAGTLSYGLRKRVELARAIAIEPELILLDEPMAGMNLEEKEDMSRFVVDINQELGMTIAMIEHDMGVVMDLSDRVLVLDFGKRIAGGRPEEVMANPNVRRAYLGQEDVAPDETGQDDAPDEAAHASAEAS